MRVSTAEKIKNTIDVEHVEELSRPYKAALHLRFIQFVCLKRQVQQRLPIARNGRQFFALFPGSLRRTTPVACMKKRNGLKEISIGNLSDDASLGTSRPKSFCKTSMPSFRPVVAVPVFSQFVA